MPPPNSYQLYKDCGFPVKLVFFEGFGHAINKPTQQRALMGQNYAWFSQDVRGKRLRVVRGHGKLRGHNKLLLKT